LRIEKCIVHIQNGIMVTTYSTEYILLLFLSETVDTMLKHVKQ